MSGPPTALRLGSAVAIPVRGRSVVAVLLVALALLATAVATLTLGRLGVPIDRLLPALVEMPGGAIGFTLERLRGPRLLAAIGVGAALGLSGALFQTVTRNPLGSPDVIGLGAGAGAGVAVTALLGGGVIPTPVGALAGAGVAITLVYLATGSGFSSPARLIVAGIGVAAMAAALTSYVVSVVLRDAGSQLAGYLAGSISATDARGAATALGTVAVVLPLALLLAPRLTLIEMGDELADALGGRAGRTRTFAIVLAVVAAAGAVSVAGPIAFVALTAGQIARRISRAPGANLCLSAMVGALVLVAADLAAQQLPVFNGLPVGVVTAGVGGLYLGALLAREWRRGRL